MFTPHKMKNDIIILRVSKSDKILLQILAKECSLSVSEFIRQTTLKTKSKW